MCDAVRWAPSTTFPAGLYSLGRPGYLRFRDFHRGKGHGAEPRGREAAVGRGSHRLHGEGRFCPHSGEAGPVSAVACAFPLRGAQLCDAVLYGSGPSKGEKPFNYVPLFMLIYGSPTGVPQLAAPPAAPPTHTFSTSLTGRSFLSPCQQKAAGRSFS